MDGIFRAVQEPQQCLQLNFALQAIDKQISRANDRSETYSDAQGNAQEQRTTMTMTEQRTCNRYSLHNTKTEWLLVYIT